ncbi:MAG: carotenoid oxygenase family protein [Halieaceae bacterium]|jgi:carotenoid cleavage dioxygenase-like enzyme|nr:carotenoid oxygenase family protein [Halieaceae bacterium]
MARMMPGNKFLEGPFAPIQMECDALDLVVEGEIPSDLSGTFYRNGPNPRFAPRGDYNWFEGDGMLHAFHIENQKVNYRNRWARTAKFYIEEKLGRNAINPMNPFDCEPEFSDFALTDKQGAANTAAVWHADRLLLLEEGHLPFEVDPVTLESKGSWTYGGKLGTAMTAHPKVDPVTGELIFFAYMATGPFVNTIALYKVSPQGLLTEQHIIETPYPAMVHDFVVTENYILFPIMPLTGDLERAMLGKPPFAWEPDRGASIAVLPRNGTAADVRWLEMDLCFVFHYMNGYDADGRITVDGCQFERPPLFPNPDGSANKLTESHLHRWTIDMNSPDGRVVSEQIDENQSEFPQVDPRFAMRAYRHGFYTSPDGKVKGKLGPDPDGALFNSICHFDHQTQSSTRYSFGNAITSEAIVVPKEGTVSEGDAYLLSVVTDLEANASSLHIFDALAVGDGPVAIAHLSHRVPAGFHGAWKPLPGR